MTREKITIRQQIAHYFEDLETPIGMGINLIIVGLIFLSLVLFIVETYSIPESWRVWLHYVDLAILSLFSIEYILRLWCAESPVKFLLSFDSIIDLLVIIPLFIGFLDIRFLRILRWFRVVRLIRLINVEISIFNWKTEESVLFARIFLNLFSLVFIASGLIYQVEHQANPAIFQNFFDALYFSIVTMTTVGFGDVTPLSQGGKAVTLCMIVSGIVLIPWQIGLLTQQLLRNRQSTTKICPRCHWRFHDNDANYCKICGTKLEINQKESGV